MVTPNQNSNSVSHNRGSGRPGSGRREASWGEVSANLDDWLAIEKDGTISAYSGKVELGTGVRTALTQIVAEELDVSIERVHLVMGRASGCAGSTSRAASPSSRRTRRRL